MKNRHNITIEKSTVDQKLIRKTFCVEYKYIAYRTNGRWAKELSSGDRVQEDVAWADRPQGDRLPIQGYRNPCAITVVVAIFRENAYLKQYVFRRK